MHNSYHDVIVAANNRTYRLFNLPFSVRLQCTRVGGWELWNTYEKDELLAGEYWHTPFSLYVKHDDKELKPTQFCHARWIHPHTAAMHTPSAEIVIGNENVTAIYSDCGLLTVVHREDVLLKMMHDYVLLTGTLFYSGLVWDVLSVILDEGRHSYTLSNPRNNGE